MGTKIVHNLEILRMSGDGVQGKITHASDEPKRNIDRIEVVHFMQIGCSKILLDYLGMPAIVLKTEIEPLFRWSANLLKINRRKVLAEINGASGYGFVLYGLTVKQRDELASLLLQGVRDCLEAENIDSKIIDRYMTDCGNELICTKTNNRSVVARLNKFCKRVEWFGSNLSKNKVAQRQILLQLNYDVVKKE